MLSKIQNIIVLDFFIVHILNRLMYPHISNAHAEFQLTNVILKRSYIANVLLIGLTIYLILYRTYEKNLTIQCLVPMYELKLAFVYIFKLLSTSHTIFVKLYY